MTRETVMVSHCIHCGKDIVKKVADKHWLHREGKSFTHSAEPCYQGDACPHISRREDVQSILRFSGDYKFLSNFYVSPIVVDSFVYPTAEHLYQSMKTNDKKWWEKIRLAETPAEAKKLGREAPLVEDWDEVKTSVMERVLLAKFTQHSDLREKLLETRPKYLIEGNDWGDEFWGMTYQHNGTMRGLNVLGSLLMNLRSEFRGEDDANK